MEFDLENPLTNPQDNHNVTLHSLFHLESDHMVSQNYTQNLQSLDFHVSLRREAVSLVLQFSGRFDPFISYLAVNYLDRFFSSQGMPVGIPPHCFFINKGCVFRKWVVVKICLVVLPLLWKTQNVSSDFGFLVCFGQQAKLWVVRLLAMSCVSLAAKMMKTEFNLSDIQCGEGFIFDSQTIERMEMLILGALQWRMRSITPFAFLEFFISLFKLKDPPLRQALKTRAIEIIFKAQNEINLLEFKPSIVAASALLSASHELFPMQFPCFRKAISSSSFVYKETLGNCCNVIQGILMEGYESVFELAAGGNGGVALSSDTPVNVLDQNWSSCSTTTTTTTTTTSGTSIITSSDLNSPAGGGGSKRQRKRNVHCSDGKLQLSQIQRC
ncbi:hypothetical protein Dimus_019774 [Dionaea muscipula]